MKKILLGLCLSVSGLMLQAQNGLENIYVERYYVADAIDAANSHPAIPVGAITYRIYADMLPGYKIQSIYGSSQHPLLMNTTTYFFNQSDYGDNLPTFNATNARKNTVMLDSWLSTGGACDGYVGVPKSDDDGIDNFLNSNVPQLLQNNAALAGIPLTTQDGMKASTVPETVTLGLDNILGVFEDGSHNGNQFNVTNGAWACLAGAMGPDPLTNKVLLAQITTDGTFHFELNIQIGTPTLGTQTYVASNPGAGEISIPSLTQTLYKDKSLNLTAFLEGFWNGSGMNQAQQTEADFITRNNFPGTTVDTLSVILRNATDPWDIVYEAHGVNINTDGTISITGIPAILSDSYYIVLNHRSSVVTWSSHPVSFSASPIHYNFSTAADKAFGSAQVDLGSGVWGLYSGDVEGTEPGIQDGYVEFFDLNSIYNGTLSETFYGYQSGDLNGDGFVEFLDLNLVYNNSILNRYMDNPIAPLGKSRGQRK
jgi:hypothetical protein